VKPLQKILKPFFVLTQICIELFLIRIASVSFQILQIEVGCRRMQQRGHVVIMADQRYNVRFRFKFMRLQVCGFRNRVAENAAEPFCVCRLFEACIVIALETHNGDRIVLKSLVGCTCL